MQSSNRGTVPACCADTSVRNRWTVPDVSDEIASERARIRIKVDLWDRGAKNQPSYSICENNLNDLIKNLDAPSPLTVEAERDAQSPLPRTQKMALRSPPRSHRPLHHLDSFRSFSVVFLDFSTGKKSPSRRSKQSSMAAQSTGPVDVSWMLPGGEQQDTNRK